ncbi:hypothetical protein GF339_15970 [candidate division KSB3 bacterium]|uniref:HMA domain-containing protein n=1 Tax=candidate division KSB3 bacterium TaxID=2044937 RepID=A0A9D5Q753_9BACT|nr:hypothetical protein [candidate division KSB3 bacterium]MBD3326083.1 hypothetical protein [candidate division KSB3 bacterium]
MRDDIQQKPVLTIVHELPGRLRMRVSEPLHDPQRLEQSVKGHSGILSVDYTAVTHSILVRFDPQEVTREEIVIRVGFSLVLALEAERIQILIGQQTREMSDSAFYSGVLLAIAVGNRFLNPYYRSGSWFEWVVTLGTAWSVLDHGMLEVRQRGNFDPEVLSVVYLVTALLRKNFLPAAIFTWLTTFGRHLLHVPATGIELQPMEFADETAENPFYEVVIHPISPMSDKQMWLSLLPSVVKYATTGRADEGPGSFIDEIRKVSQLHGEVLEGLGGLRSGIPLKIR